MDPRDYPELQTRRAMTPHLVLPLQPIADSAVEEISEVEPEPEKEAPFEVVNADEITSWQEEPEIMDSARHNRLKV
jgi:hypothetical protein